MQTILIILSHNHIFVIKTGCQEIVVPESPARVVETMPMTLFPSVIPKELIDEALDLQIHYNTLMHKVAYDHEFMYLCLKE